MIVPAIVQQHADDTASLAFNRLSLVESPHATLDRLAEFDRRVRANLSGLQLAGEHGLSICDARLEAPSAGALFAVAVRALEDRDGARLDRVFALACAVPETIDGLLAAFEWVAPKRLQNTVAGLLRNQDEFKRMTGVSACAAHRVDPGIASGAFLRDPSSRVRARSSRAVGELGLSPDRGTTIAMLTDADAETRLWSAWSAVLLGERQRGLDALTQHASSPGPHRARAFRLALQAMPTDRAHEFLQGLAAKAEEKRWLIHGSGIAGDPSYCSWLLKLMNDSLTARLAGEAFSMITGIQLGEAALSRPAPQEFDSGPNDNPDDPDVEMDPDDGLPWPDAEKIDKCWTANSGRFQKSTRYFVGKPVTREHCIDVLKNGYQRQRILAAHYLCLLEPGTPLFNTSAPAWRQQRLLAAM